MNWGQLFGRGRKKKRDEKGEASPLSDLIAIVDDTVDPRLVVSRDPTGPLAEQYRSFRTNFLASHAGTGRKVFCITSAQREEGKSVSAANIAVCFGEMDPNKICLVDADLRNPALAAMWSVRSIPGLSEVLRGEVPLDRAIVDTRRSNLHLVPAGEPPSSPAELILNPRLKQTFASLKASYDYVFVDTPPATVFSDAAMIGALCDGIILVTRINFTSRDLVDRATQTLTNAGGKVVGALLTALPSTGAERREEFFTGR